MYVKDGFALCRESCSSFIDASSEKLTPQFMRHGAVLYCKLILEVEEA